MKNKKTIKKNNKILIILLSIMLIINIYILTFKVFFKTELPTVFGIVGLFDVSSELLPESNEGDLTMLKEQKEYNKNDLVAVYSNNDFVIQQIVEKIDEGYITKSYNSDIVNENIVKEEQIQGAVFHVVQNGELLINSIVFVLVSFVILIHISKFELKKKNNEKHNQLDNKKEKNILKNKIEEMKKSLKTKRAVEVLSLFVVVGIVFSLTYARYTSTATATVEYEIANFYIEGMYTNYQTISLTDLAPGDEKKFTIDILNYNDTTINQVTQDYSISLYTTGNIPLNYSIEEVNTELGQTYVQNFIQEDKIYTASGGILNHTEKEKHTYEITISWPEEQKDEKYSKEIDYIQLIIDGKQKN